MMVLLGRKKIYKEIEECEVLLEKRPDDFSLLKRLADLYVRINEKKKAAERYVKVGDTYKDSGFYPKAIALYTQAQKIAPEWEESYKKLVTLYTIQGFLKEASLQYKHLSELMEKTGDKEKAFLYMEKSTELIPAYHKISQRILSLDVKEKNKIPEPLRLYVPKSQKNEFGSFNFEKELDKEIKNLSVDETRSDKIDTTGMQSVFRAISEGGTKEEADDPLFLYNMGLAYIETGFLDEAIDAFKKVTAREKGERVFDAYVMLGITLRKKGGLQESLETLRKSTLIEETPPEMKLSIFYEIAQTYKAMGDTARAFAILKELQKDDRDFRTIEKIAEILPKGN